MVVPGSLAQRTGGYIYDRRVVEGLIKAGWAVEVHELEGVFPNADVAAIEAASSAIEAMEGGMPVVDGLALLAFEPMIDRLPRPWIGLIHHPLALETGLSATDATAFAARESRLMAKAAKLVVTSPRTKRDLEDFDVDPGKVSVVVPGVDPAEPAAGSGDQQPRSLLSVGSLTKRKGYPVLLEALSGLVDLDWHLRIVGSAVWDPDHAAHIKAMIGDLGLSARVDLVGEQDEAGLAGFYHRADLFVLASHHEGYGMVLAEALARGLPVVSTRAGAIPDTVPEEAGRLVPPNDVPALRAALRDVLTDRPLYHELKENALLVRRTLPDWTEVAARFGAVLEKGGWP